MRPGDVAAATRPDRQRRARTARRAEDHAVADDRRRDHLVGVAAAPPQLPAALRVVRLHLLLATDDDLVAGADAHRDRRAPPVAGLTRRSEEHTSELQSQSNLVCRLLLEKKK